MNQPSGHRPARSATGVIGGMPARQRPIARLPVLDSAIAYQDIGSGSPIVCLHGNPTSSYLWRNVLPLLPGRALAPDLIGMGESGKPDIAHTFDDHSRYLDAWMDAMNLDAVILVGHDWGAALACDWAARHPDRVRAIAFSEAVIKPMTWSEFPLGAHGFFRAARTADNGEALVLDANAFLDQVLPGTVARPLSSGDLAAYHAPFPDRVSRRPLLAWARSLPLDGQPGDVVARFSAFAQWLAHSTDVPKLSVTFQPGPGTMTTTATQKWCTATLAALETEHIDGLAGHHTPEDQPEALAAAIRTWIDRRL
jgi:haloalkane dehalogenase